ncbi:TPA: recombinase family protein, partial [Klebsiella quasipneumoniae subsp. similipneumoniae]|nr:recombinase family protein [Klebsiella quasipneumoniae subsp. similipneumoniae]
ANQVSAIHAKGHKVTASRVITDEGVSGSVPAMKRPAFANLVNNKLEEGDTLIVLKLDRLGRDNIDVQQTINMLIEKGVNVQCLDLPIPNLTSNEGKLMLQMFASFAEFERNRIRERTAEAIANRKEKGLPVGRPEAVETTQAVRRCKEQKMSQSITAKELGLSIATVKRHWNKG